MSDSPPILIAFPDSPYRVLGVAFDADAKAVNRAMRTLFRKDPRNGAAKGNRAQKQLTDPRQRIREDAFCVPADMPALDLRELADRLQAAPGTFRCRALEQPLLFSDLFFAPERLAKPPNVKDLPVRVPYRAAYDRRSAPGEPKNETD